MKWCLVDSDVEDPDLWENVGVHEQRSIGVRRDGGGGRLAGAQLKGSLRVSTGVDDERISQPAQAVQHNEGWRQSRLQGLRHRYTDRLRLEVTTFTFDSNQSFNQSVYSLHSKAYEWRAFSLYRRLQDQNWKTQQKATRKLKQKKLLTKRNRTKRSMTKADRCESRNRCELSVPWQIEQTKIWELMHRKSIRKPRLAYIQKTFRFHVPDSSIWW